MAELIVSRFNRIMKPLLVIDLLQNIPEKRRGEQQHQRPTETPVNQPTHNPTADSLLERGKESFGLFVLWKKFLSFPLSSSFALSSCTICHTLEIGSINGDKYRSMIFKKRSKALHKSQCNPKLVRVPHGCKKNSGQASRKYYIPIAKDEVKKLRRNSKSWTLCNR